VQKTNEKLNAVSHPRPAVATFLAAAALVALAGCGSDSSSPVTPPTPTPTATPAPTPTPTTVVCNPTPPPLYGISVTILDASSYKKVIGARPIVANYDGYCGKVGFDPNQGFCNTRPDGDPMRAACDAAAVGRSGDTGRWGPTWYYEGGPCNPGNSEGCENYPTDQFKAYAKGWGEFAACAAPTIEIDPEGSRCGVIQINN
jgi:hypothetical protein